MSTSTDKKKEPGVVYTFYSFKGGAGRSMALANVATLMARWGYSVLAVDWDLEAPGLERFLGSRSDHVRNLRASRPGIVDLMHSRATDDRLDWRDCVVKIRDGVSMISAGRDDGEYIANMQRLDFEYLFQEHDLGRYIESLRAEWISLFDFVLIDSRTGVTDMGGICTVHLPDILVLFFTANESSVDGALDVVRRARGAQERLPLDRGRLVAVPVPSRDESRTEYRRAAEWKKIFAERFADIYSDWLPREVKAEDAVELLRIPYVPYWSFGEPLPVLQEGANDVSSLGYSYSLLARLLASRLNWSGVAEGRRISPLPSEKRTELDPAWLNRHREAAMKGLRTAQRSGFMEVYHFCLDPVPAKKQTELLRIAELAAVHTFGWPIGVVLGSRGELRPRPTNEGIVANMNTGHDYDYWVLTRHGDFYTLTSLFEDGRRDNVIFFDTRIVRATEAILHCINLYKGFGVDTDRTAFLSIRYGGLKGRKLTNASPSRLLPFDYPESQEDDVETSAAFRIGINAREIATLVKALCEPLFMLFDFHQFQDSVYGQIVSDFIQGKVS